MILIHGLSHFLSGLLIILIGLIWLTGTPSGKQWGLQKISFYTPIKIKNIQGMLFEQFIIHDIKYKNISIPQLIVLRKNSTIHIMLPSTSITKFLPLIQPTPSFLKSLKNMRGNIKIHMTIPLNKIPPPISATMMLEKASVEISKLGLQLKNIFLENHISETGDMRLSGQLRSGNGILTIQIQGRLTNLNAPFHIKIFGKNIQAINTTEYRATISPELFAILKNRHVSIRGSIFIPQAKLKPEKFNTRAITLSNDVIFLKPKEKPIPFFWDSKVFVKLGNEITIELYGMQGNITGGIEITDDSDRFTSAKGELFLDANYQAYGQNLKIPHGRIIFNGGSIQDPLLDIKATKEIKLAHALDQFIGSDRTTVGIAVTGHLNNRHIALFSEPIKLSQTDILSYLVLNQPASQAGKADGQLLFNAISGLGGGRSSQLNQLTKKLESAFGLSKIEIGGGTPGTEQRMALTLGKSLSSRLYVEYGIGLFEALQTLRLRYFLTSHFLIQTETSRTANALDLLYSNER